MRRRIIVALELLVLCCWTQTLLAQTDHSYPMLLSVHPPAIQTGKSSDVTITSYYLQRDAYQVFVSGTGVRGEPLPEPPPKPGAKIPANRRTKFERAYRFTVDANALPRIRDFRIATDQGVSTLGQIVVTRDPVVLENEKPLNDTLETAQAINWPATVCGTLNQAEDVDFFKFRVQAGQRLIFFVRGATLQYKLHDFEGVLDPQLTLFDAAGTTLASANNSVGGDPLLAYTFREAGEYRLQIRDVRYKGNPEWVYTLEIHDRPFVTQVFPPAVPSRQKSVVAPIGHNLPTSPKLEISIPNGAEQGVRLTSGTIDGVVTNELPVFVASQPITLENSGSQDIARGGQLIVVPALVCGRIESPGNIDRYAFTAKRGERFTFEAFARRCRSRLDAVLRILNEKGAVLAENDDQASANLRTSDSQIENWAAPADGRYTLEIRDLNGAGGPEFVYALDLSHSRPSFRLELESDKSHLSPGLSYPIYVHADRRSGFKGEIRLAVSDLPAGISAEAGIIPKGASHGCVILTAAANAPRGTGSVRITGTGLVDTGDKNSKAQQPLTVMAMPLGDIRTAGRPLFVIVSSHSVSVGPPQNLCSLKISTRELQLKPGESKQVDVTIERVPQYTGLVRLESYVHYFEQTHATTLPRGVTLDLEKSKAILGPGETHGTLVFHADEDAKPCERQLVPVMAQVAMSLSIRFSYCQPLWMSVAAVKK